jgi:hypothetical protein
MDLIMHNNNNDDEAQQWWNWWSTKLPKLMMHNTDEPMKAQSRWNQRCTTTKKPTIHNNDETIISLISIDATSLIFVAVKMKKYQVSLFHCQNHTADLFLSTYQQQLPATSTTVGNNNNIYVDAAISKNIDDGQQRQ